MANFIDITDYDATIHREILDSLLRKDSASYDPQIIEICEDRAISEMRSYWCTFALGWFIASYKDVRNSFECNLHLPKFLSWMDSNAFSMYLVHQFVINVALFGCARLVGICNPVVILFVMVVTTFSLTFGCCLIYNAIVKLAIPILQKHVRIRRAT